MKTYTFTIVVEKEPGGPGYYAHHSSLPGCLGAGMTVEETIENMRQATA